MKNKFSIFIIIIFLSFCFVIFYKGLNAPNNYTPKVNEKKNVPTFKAKDFYSNNYINSDEIFEENIFYIVNIWASWCVPCRVEHPLLMQLSKNQSIKLIGLNYRDNYNKSEIFFKKIEESKESNFNAIIASFEIKDKNGKTIELKPEIRIYNQPIIITSEADIRTTLLEDKFLVMNLVKGNEYFNIRYQVKPFMVWIWISVLLLSLGGLMSLFKRKI